MTNAQRVKLETKILEYANAKALAAALETPHARPAAERAVERWWGRIMEVLNEIQAS